MRRRDFISLVGSSAVAWPLAARAQQHGGPARLAFIPLGSPSNPYDRSLVEAFQRGLRRVGLIENQDVALDIVWAGDRPDQAVSEALQRGANLLIPCGSSASVAAKRQTSTIPIVFLSVGDPVVIGLVQSLSRPGQNATGFSDILAELSGKLVDVARELIKPHMIIHYLWHTAWPDGQNRYRATEQAVRAAGMQLQARGIAEISELDAAVAAMKLSGSPAWPVAAKEEGALVGYGPDYVHMYSRAPFYVDRVLKGTKPADLPVERPSKVEFVVNLQTAKALGIEVPLPLLVRADEFHWAIQCRR
jgi:putative ABC transport system substrate-binding protein